LPSLYFLFFSGNATTAIKDAARFKGHPLRFLAFGDSGTAPKRHAMRLAQLQHWWTQTLWPPQFSQPQQLQTKATRIFVAAPAFFPVAASDVLAQTGV
jgi:hypothetical protein